MAMIVTNVEQKSRQKPGIAAILPRHEYKSRDQKFPIHTSPFYTIHGPTQSGEVTGSHILHKPQTSHIYSGTCVAMLYLLAEMTNTLPNCHSVQGSILYLQTHR